MKPLVSILIPAFNAQKWISDTLRSAIAQTWNPKEIIVVDDGSTDDTLKVARQFESDCVHVTTHANQGAAATRNMAYSMSRGDFIQWLDADDLLAPNKIAKQMETMAQLPNNRTLLSSPWAHFLVCPHRANFFPTPLWNDLSPVEWLIRKMGKNLHMQTATWLVSRELTEAAGPWDTSLLGDDDGEYFCRVLLQSEGVRFIPGARVYYRSTGSGSLSYVGHSTRKMEAQWRSMKLHIGYLRSLEDSPRTRAACVSYLQNWALYFYPDRLDIFEQARQFAEELGGRLEIPELSWKYRWIKSIFGWGLAKKAKVCFPRVRWAAERSWDRILFHLEGYRNPARPFPQG